MDIVCNARQHIHSSTIVVSEAEDVEAEEWKKALERIEIFHSNAKQISVVAEEIRLLREELCIAPFSIPRRNRSRTPIRSHLSLSPTISTKNSPTTTLTISPTLTPPRSPLNSPRTSSQNTPKSIVERLQKRLPHSSVLTVPPILVEIVSQLVCP